MALNSVKRLEYIEKTITAQELVNVGYPEFYKKTPERTGNARRHTKKTKDSIDANYPYAKRLDEGYSPKSPQGMVKPTIDVIRAYIKKKLGV